MKPIIFGIAGTVLSDEERVFFGQHQPYGFILFKRNCQSREQIISLVNDLKTISSKIFIDQEGGRVARITPPIIAKTYPPGAHFGQLAESKGLEFAQNAARQNYKELMSDLLELGINITCAPLVDMHFEGAHDVIGDRAFSTDPSIVSALSIATLEGLRSAGGEGVIKHIPGHGRSTCDSHLDLPIVDAPLEVLEKTDFAAFKPLSQIAHYAMTAHIIYKALDPDQPATLSKIVVDYIRKEIGFTGKLMTDDLSMKALKGSLSDLTKKSLKAGCDLILHCNGNMEEMIEIAGAISAK
jgi:beta-N-acetylhexosaminidase